MSHHPLKVGFIGLGNMGLPMAQNILKRQFPLFIFNRTFSKADSLINQGARWVQSPRELGAQCDVVITMVSDDEVLKDLVEGKEGLLQGEKYPSVHVSMSTVSPHLTQDLEKKHQALGIQYLAAPVSGRPERAKEGTLWIFLAGHSQAKIQVEPILKAMSCQIFDLGEKAHQAALFKLCNNFMILSFIESFAEASTMLEKEGISAETAASVWGQSLFDSPVFHAYKSMLCKRSFSEGGFSLKLGLKDMRLLKESADQTQTTMPFLDELHEKLLTSMNLGRENFDWSAISLLSRFQSGL